MAIYGGLNEEKSKNINMTLKILGIHCGHDRSAALLIDGKIVCAIEEERLDRRKHSSGLETPLKAIRYCLESQGLLLKDIDHLAVTSTQSQSQIFGLDMFDSTKIQFVSHHLAHASSAYFTSGKSSSGILVCDGTGGLISENKREAESIFLGNGKTIELKQARTTRNTKGITISDIESNMDIYLNDLSWGNLYNNASRLIFGDWKYSGKVMALAGFSANKLNLNLFLDKHKTRYSVFYPGTYLNQFRKAYLLNTPIGFNTAVTVAQAVQDALKQNISNLAATVLEVTESRSLCYSGGVAYNCLINTHLLMNGICDDLHIFPACGDAGCSVGAALYVHSLFEEDFVPQRIKLPFYGREYTNEQIKNAVLPFIKKNFLQDRLQLVSELSSDNMVISDICQDIEDGKIVCLFRSQSEFGPRALGNRSILANPQLPDIQFHLNRMKGREWFRPLAVMILAEKVDDIFKYKLDSPYMLLTNEFRDEQLYKEFYVGHVDRSIRFQTVSSRDSQFHYNLLRRWYQISGTPLLVNTSFNRSGEPIVENPVDAVKSFLNIGADSLYLGWLKFSRKSHRK